RHRSLPPFPTRRSSDLLYALSFLLLFTIGGLTGLFLGVLAIDVHLHDTYFVVAHFHYVMMGSTLVAFLGALHYWWPKFTGKMYRSEEHTSELQSLTSIA